MRYEKTKRRDASLYKRVVCFDLDDTLYPEIEFVRSAFFELSGEDEGLTRQMLLWREQGENVFERLNRILHRNIAIEDYLSRYRSHKPRIQLSEETTEVLRRLCSMDMVLGLITDGRSQTQRLKIQALGLDAFFPPENIVISEESGFDKTSPDNFAFFMHRYPQAEQYYYIGDNPDKDFRMPKSLGWKTMMLMDNGVNIHPQKEVSKEYAPDVILDSLSQLFQYLLYEK